MVSRDNIAALYTLIALCDSAGMMVGPLMFNRSYALAIGWDDQRYLGLPFFIAAACFLLGAFGTLAKRCCR